MSMFAKVLCASAAALAGSAALAQTSPAPSSASPGKPDAAPQASYGCPMTNGQAMMNGTAMGAHMQNGRMVDKDGKPIVGGMMGQNGMPCVPRTAAITPPVKAAPKADK